MSHASGTQVEPALPLFSRRLKVARLRSNFSQERLGVAAGMDAFSASARINQYERGRHMPDVLMSRRLAQVLGVPLSYFWAADDDEAELLRLFHALGGDGRKRVLCLLQELTVSR